MLNFFKGSHSNVWNYWNEAFVHVQVRFCLQDRGGRQSNLGSRIKVERIPFEDESDLKHFPVDLFADTEGNLTKMEKYTVAEVGKGKADLMVYMAYDDTDADYATSRREAFTCLRQFLTYCATTITLAMILLSQQDKSKIVLMF